MAVVITVSIVLAVSIPTIVVSNLIRRLLSDCSIHRNLPWVGMKEHGGRLARARANLKSIFHLRELLDEGYAKYSKNDQTYVLPYAINGPQVILPTSQISWLLEQPDSVLSQEKVNRQFLEADYTFFHANRADAPVHPEIIHHQLTKKLGTSSHAVADEMVASLEDNWGLGTEWHEVKVYDTMLDVIARLSIRVFMGMPLCRNKRFLSACSSFIRNVALAAAGISLFPKFLKPIVAPVFTLYDFIQLRRCNRFMLPIIRERLERLKMTNKLPLVDVKPPNDYVQWSIEHALAKPMTNPAVLDASVIACRFSVLAFAAIQSSVITLTNTLFDLAGSEDCEASLAAMRDEVLYETEKPSLSSGFPASALFSTTSMTLPTNTVQDSSASWSRPVLSRMVHIDSALRESLRINGFIERGIMKMVVAPEGVTLPDGSHIPCGTKVGVSGYSVHHDDDVYADAVRYDAFRFVQGPDEDKKPLSLVNTSESFMGFSHGSHACPGRFFAANQLKIALAHIALHYEIEPIAQRPVNRWFFGHIAPPLTQTLRVRRRVC